MSEIVRRMAEAQSLERAKVVPNETQQEAESRVARAGLSAMREPTDDMVQAFWKSEAVAADSEPGGVMEHSEWYGSRSQFNGAFRAMIDAALK